jgi:hypothetical protein
MTVSLTTSQWYSCFFRLIESPGISAARSLSGLASPAKPVSKSDRQEPLGASQAFPQGHIGPLQGTTLDELPGQAQDSGPVHDFFRAEAQCPHFPEHGGLIREKAVNDHVIDGHGEMRNRGLVALFAHSFEPVLSPNGPISHDVDFATGRNHLKLIDFSSSGQIESRRFERNR